MSVYRTGLSGEEQAERYLHSRGYETVARRWRGEDGEIDLIMKDGEFIVLVEVKFRPSGRSGDGLKAVTPAKRRRMTHAAEAFLMEREWMNVPVRFDVVEITRDGMNHVINAFYAGT